MKLIIVVLTALFHVAASAEGKKLLSLLAIDGGGIKGIIPATCIDHMEEFAYDYVVNVKKYTTWTPYKDENGDTIKRMPMSDIFDFFAGTSTGSILATALVIPEEKGSRKPKFWGAQGADLYAKNAAVIFNASHISTA